MKASKRLAEFQFYRDTPLDMIGCAVGVELVPVEDGASAFKAWVAKDERGKELPCYEPEVLAKARRGKSSWNLQVKMWAEGVAEGLFTQDEMLDYCHEHHCPGWVLVAVYRQAASLCLAEIGFVPRFARLVYFNGVIWFPWMDDFDPSI